MHNKLARTTVLAPAALMLILLAGCSSIKVDKLWPFDDNSDSARTRLPANTTLYQCAGGKHFHLRIVDNGSSAWLIYPDREVSLTKAATGSRYSNGIAVLEINGNDATLTDGTTITYTDCKAAAK